MRTGTMIDAARDALQAASVYRAARQVIEDWENGRLSPGYGYGGKASESLQALRSAVSGRILSDVIEDAMRDEKEETPND